MNYNWCLLVLVSLVCVNCVASETEEEPFVFSTEMVYDPTLSVQDLNVIREAAAHWCVAADADWACITLVGETTEQKPSWQDVRNHHVSTVWRSQEGDPLWHTDATKEHAATSTKVSIIFYDRVVLSSALHEMGHLFGLGHEDGKVMQAADCIDQEALDALCSLHECGPNAAPTCE